MRFGPEPSLHNTREWLSASHKTLTQRKEAIAHPSYTEDIAFKNMTRNQQVYMAVLRGLVDTVYDSFTSNSASSSPPVTPIASVPPTPITPSPASSIPSTPPSSSPSSRPETLYLDKSRLNNLSTEASDVTALYMFMLLFRQLAFIDLGPSGSTRPVRSVDEEDILQLRQELIDIGPTKMGTCFVPRTGEPSLAEMTEKQKKDVGLRRSVRLDLVLQIAKRASDLRRRKSAASLLSTGAAPFGDAPDPRLVTIATTWVETNMQPGSTLSSLLHHRMREVLFDLVVSLAYPSKNVVSLAAAANGSLRTTSIPGTATSAHTSGVPTTIASYPTPKNHLPMLTTPEDDNSPSSPIAAAIARAPSTSTSPHLKIDLYSSTRLLTTAEAVTSNHQPGMEGILEDARGLAEKLARLSLIHLNTFLPVYESEGFLIRLDGFGELVGR